LTHLTVYKCISDRCGKWWDGLVDILFWWSTLRAIWGKCRWIRPVVSCICLMCIWFWQWSRSFCTSLYIMLYYTVLDYVILYIYLMGYVMYFMSIYILYLIHIVIICLFIYHLFYIVCFYCHSYSLNGLLLIFRGLTPQHRFLLLCCGFTPQHCHTVWG
jgi:hypothetical protein